MSLEFIHGHHSMNGMTNALLDLTFHFRNRPIFQTATMTPMMTSPLTISLSQRGRCLRRFARRDGHPLPVHPGDRFVGEISSIQFHRLKMQTSAMRTGAL